MVVIEKTKDDQYEFDALTLFTVTPEGDDCAVIKTIAITGIDKPQIAYEDYQEGAASYMVSVDMNTAQNDQELVVTATTEGNVIKSKSILFSFCDPT